MSGPEDGRDGRSGDEDMPEEIDTDINDIIELDQEELHAGDDDDGQFDVEGSPSKSQENNRDREQQERKDDDKSDKPREKSKDRNRDRDRDRNRDRDGRRDRRDSGRRDQGGRRDQRGGRFHPYGGRDRDGGRDRTMGRVVFVSNIPFEMKWQELKDLMRKEVGEVTYTELFYDPDGKSKGVGVVEFASRDSLNRCIDKMNKFQIRGRGLVVKVDTDRRYSDKYRRQADKEQKARVMLTPQVLAQLNLDPSTVTDTVFVSNIPFDVEWMELKDVFQIAGKVIHCDILTDNRGKSKGSATVKFESILEAVNAISMLHNQMLYSRKLSVKMDQAKRDRDRPPKQLPLPSGLSRLGPSLESLASGMGSGLGGGSRGGLGGGMGGGLGGGLGGGGGMGNMGMGNMGNMGGMDSGLGNLGNFGGLGGGLDANRMSNLGGNTGLGGGFGGNLSSGLGGNLSSGLGSSLGSSLGGMGGFGGGDLSQSSLGMGGLGSLGMGSDLSLMGNMGGGGGGSGIGGGGGSGGGLGLLGSGMGMGMGKDTFGDSMGTMRDDRDRDRGRDRGDRDRRGGGGGRDRDRDRDNFRGRGGDSGSQVFVRNLPFKYTWQDLKDRFKMIGPVQFAEVKTHPETGRSKGFGTVRFQNPNDAMKAIREMNGSRLDGREIEVSLDYA